MMLSKWNNSAFMLYTPTDQVPFDPYGAFCDVRVDPWVLQCWLKCTILTPTDDAAEVALWLPVQSIICACQRTTRVRRASISVATGAYHVVSNPGATFSPRCRAIFMVSDWN